MQEQTKNTKYLQWRSETWDATMVALVAESLADEQAREEEEEEQGAGGSCGAATGHNPPSPKWEDG